MFFCAQKCHAGTLLKTNIAPENGWLEYDPCLLGFGLLSGAFAVSFREGKLVQFKFVKILDLGIG